MGDGDERDARVDLSDVDIPGGGPGAGAVDLVRALGALVLDPGAGAAPQDEPDADPAPVVVPDEEDGDGTAR